MRLRPPFWLFPRRWRERYATEAEEIFDSTGRRFTDWLNLLLTGLLLQLETQMRYVVSGALTIVVAISLVVVGYAIAELAEGPREVHRHWWSVAPLGVVAVSAGALLLLRHATQQDQPTWGDGVASIRSRRRPLQ